MIDKFMLNNAKEMFQTVSNTYLKRYDLSDEWSQLSKHVEKCQKMMRREPFMYELIGDLLRDLKDSIKNQVLNKLYQKDKEWFFKIGQYCFYNFSQWIKHGNFEQDNSSLMDFKKKWLSKFLEFEQDVPNKKKISYPRKILLELTNNCNLNCVMCGIGKNGYDPDKNMSIDFLASLSDNVLTKAEIIRLNGLGESTILPNFLDYLAILSKLDVQLEIVTNLTVSNTKIWDKLLESNTNFLISCDSATPKLYESIRRGASFFGFKKNLRYIGANLSTPLQGQIIFTLMECNFYEIPKMVDLVAEIGLGGVIINVVKTDSTQSKWMYQKIDKIMELFQKAYNLAKSYEIALKLPDHIGKIPVNKNIANSSCHLHCSNPWEEVYIRYNGDLTVCNMLNPYIYGNCQYYSFEEVWNGLNTKLFRSFVNTKFRHYYCRECYYLV
ncbi:MAG: radical SAM protein [Promethearchaeota archaeon]